MPAQAKDLGELFYDTLRDIYYAEKQILKALPKMARAAQAPELKRAFEEHLDETENARRAATKSVRANRQARSRQNL